MQVKESAVVDDLSGYSTTAEGSCLVVAGPWQSPAVHALAHAINQQLGAVGASVRYCKPFDATESLAAGTLAELAGEMRQGDVQMLLALDVNPIYAAPASLEFAEALTSVPSKIHFGQFEDETSIACDWHIPAQHYLESWGDGRAFDGTLSVIQPLIAPLH